MMSNIELWRAAEALIAARNEDAATYAAEKAKLAAQQDKISAAADWKAIELMARRIWADQHPEPLGIRIKRLFHLASSAVHPIGIRPLPDSERTRQRSELITHAFRGLLLVHGGAAVALLAFLQSTWKVAPELAGLILNVLFWFGLGLASGLIAMFLRYWTSLLDQRGSPWWKYAQKLYWAALWAGFVLFLVAIWRLTIDGAALIESSINSSPPFL